jgi:acylphosphatase
MLCKRCLVGGRVQGVFYRASAQQRAHELGVRGYARNLDDGRVEVYAAGPVEALNEFAGMLHRGPRFSDVRGVDEQEAEVRSARGTNGFLYRMNWMAC